MLKVQEKGKAKCISPLATICVTYYVCLRNFSTTEGETLKLPSCYKHVTLITQIPL